MLAVLVNGKTEISIVCLLEVRTKGTSFAHVIFLYNDSLDTVSFKK